MRRVRGGGQGQGVEGGLWGEGYSGEGWDSAWVGLWVVGEEYVTKQCSIIPLLPSLPNNPASGSRGRGQDFAQCGGSRSLESVSFPWIRIRFKSGLDPDLTKALETEQIITLIVLHTI